METTKQTSKEYFRTLSILHIALILGQVFFALITVFLIINKIMIGQRDLSVILAYITPIFTLISLFFSNYFYKKKLKPLQESNDLKYKMTNYRGVLVIRYALIEGPSFFSIVVTLLTSNLVFLVLPVLLIIWMIYLKPSKYRVLTDLELDENEIEIINNPDEIIAEFNDF